MENLDDKLIDDFSEEILEPVNLLRERTFNSELRSLVSRISDNEESFDDSNKVSNREREQNKDKNNLLEKLHQLYYQLLYDDQISLSFQNNNDFLLNETVDNKKNRVNFLLSINKRLSLFELSNFSIFDYSFKDQCYKSFNDCFFKDLFIGLKDIEYGKIVNSEYGFRLNLEDIKDNILLSKKFSEDFLLKSGFIFFVNINKFLSVFTNEMKKKFELKLGNIFLFDSIFALFCENSVELNEKEIFDLLKELLFPEIFKILDVLDQKKIGKIDTGFYSHLNIISSFQDYIDSNFQFRSFNLIVSDVLNKKIDFIVKYLFVKLNEKLENGLIILSVSETVFFLIIKARETEILYNIIDEYNSVWNNLFSLESK